MRCFTEAHIFRRVPPAIVETITRKSPHPNKRLPMVCTAVLMVLILVTCRGPFCLDNFAGINFKTSSFWMEASAIWICIVLGVKSRACSLGQNSQCDALNSRCTSITELQNVSLD